MWGASLIGSDTQLNQRSYYEASVQRGPARAPLQEHLKVDAVVVGAGFSGLSAALEMARRGLSVAVLEADRIGSGASGRNGGQAIVGYASGQGPFEQQLGREDAERAWAMSVEAVDLIDQRIAEHGIACDRRFGYVYVAETARKARELRAEMDGLAARGIAVDWAEGADLPRLINSPRYVAAAREQRSGHLHPLKYALGLARAAGAAGVRFFEQAPGTGLQRGTTLVAQVSSPAALALGATPLQPEKADNYSLGVTWDPSAAFHLALDAYQIDIRGQLGQLRLRKHTGQVEKTHELRSLRKDVARLETILKQKKSQAA